MHNRWELQIIQNGFLLYPVNSDHWGPNMPMLCFETVDGLLNYLREKLPAPPDATPKDSAGALKETNE